MGVNRRLKKWGAAFAIAMVLTVTAMGLPGTVMTVNAEENVIYADTAALDDSTVVTMRMDVSETKVLLEGGETLEKTGRTTDNILPIALLAVAIFGLFGLICVFGEDSRF